MCVCVCVGGALHCTHVSPTVSWYHCVPCALTLHPTEKGIGGSCQSAPLSKSLHARAFLDSRRIRTNGQKVQRIGLSYGGDLEHTAVTSEICEVVKGRAPPRCWPCEELLLLWFPKTSIQTSPRASATSRRLSRTPPRPQCRRQLSCSTTGRDLPWRKGRGRRKVRSGSFGRWARHGAASGCVCDKVLGGSQAIARTRTMMT